MIKKRIDILIADDHGIFRSGLKTLLSRIPYFNVCGEVTNGEDLLHLAQEMKPDVIITDIDMPLLNGIQATKEICRKLSETKVLVLSVHAGEEYIVKMIDAGAMGYILKSADTEEIIEAVQTLNQSKPYFCKTITEKLTDIISKHIKIPTREPIYFTEREKEIMQLICDEHTSKAIAHELSLSKRTIEGHRTRIMDKIGAKSVAGIISYSFENGIYKKRVER